MITTSIMNSRVSKFHRCLLKNPKSSRTKNYRLITRAIWRSPLSLKLSLKRPSSILLLALAELYRKKNVWPALTCNRARAHIPYLRILKLEVTARPSNQLITVMMSISLLSIQEGGHPWLSTSWKETISSQSLLSYKTIWALPRNLRAAKWACGHQSRN